jgi:hypothetical protein
LLLSLGLATEFNWGITDAEATQVAQQLELANRVPHGAPKNQFYVLADMVAITIKFYIHKYGIPLFTAATLAAFVITWNVVNWADNK